MGRRLTGAALRADKRGKIAAREIVEAKAQETETQQVTTKADEELFVLDTTAVLPSKKQLEKKDKKKRQYESSAKEQVQIEKLVETHTAEKLQELAKTTTATRAQIRKAVRPTFDLWGDEVKPKPAKKKKIAPVADPAIGATLKGIKPDLHCKTGTKKALPAPKGNKVTIDVAKSGQSYNPDRVLHRKVIDEAVEVETKRLEAEEEKKAPISAGMTAETRALLVGDSDTDDSDAEDASGEKDEEEQTIEKKQEKLTRAQRNKQKRVRAELHEIQERKRQKKIQNAVGEAKTVSKALKKKDAAKKVHNEVIQRLKEESERTKGKDVYKRLADENPITAPTYPVALPSELKAGSLRTLKPKGSLITDRMASLLDRDMAAKKQKKRKRVQGKRRKMRIKVRGKGYAESREEAILG